MTNLIAFALPSPFPGGGWGNGYVALPVGHPLYEKDYMDIDDIDINGGLTYSSHYNERRDPIETKGMWIIGFDTLHSHDSIEMWPNEESIMNEANKLKDQIIDEKYTIRPEPVQD